MAETEFFGDEDKEKEEPKTDTEQTEEPGKIKVGDQEFTQDELSKLVGLGKVAVEAEEKYNRPISRFWPEYTKSQQKVTELEEELRKSKATQVAPQTPETQLSEEQIQAKAIEQAEKLGLVHKGNVQQFVSEVVEGYRLLDSVNDVIDEAKDAGKPKVSEQEMLDYMRETGIKNPKIAYEIKFKDALVKWGERQLQKVRPDAITTQGASTAGAKQPPQPSSPTKEDLAERVREHFSKARGSETT